jgi:N-carbamoylputrescine amidase
MARPVTGRHVTLGVVQFACSDEVAANVATADRLVRQAAGEGANVVLVQELFEGLYFCSAQRPDEFARARPLDGHPTVAHFARLAAELGVVIPVSVFEKANRAYFNSVVLLDADGREAGRYRKSHIPDGVGYQEKYYFNPGDTGFRVFDTRFGRIGIGICWDQWFPEAARAMALKGAELILYPTAIGSEPPDPSIDSRDHWQMVMRGHAAANLTPVAAANRVGTERGPDGTEITFYGSSFIAGPTGALLTSAERSGEAVLTATFDLDAIAAQRAGWGLFRDRRPDLYAPLMTLDGG